MAGTTVAFMICSLIYSLIKIFTRKSWSSLMFCRFTKCDNDKIKVVYKYRIIDEVAGYEVSEHNEFCLQAATAAIDQQGDECITTNNVDVFNDNCKNDSEFIYGSEEELVSDDSNSCSIEEVQTEEEIDVPPIVVNCPADFETKKFKPVTKEYFYFVEVDNLKNLNNYDNRIGVRKSKKNPSSKKSPKSPQFNDWYGKDIKIRPCPKEYKKPWWTRVDPSKY
ncbi:uncharacterized protein OCT59_015323 [Rhizophagus irregularis]|uniref:Uncharacterized protein n=3 Tax=Rhizophagus irregularis TaxID=588596 RepID=U9UFL6_RHIID|nr:hypothetical protein GLOIN_2v1499376 [Rhizophagus irregularis DAOM 181602=DAOM 197198]EXX75862.1 hypothetical protein RirG_038340 [Rhizophagus irregularis DAOM 197198w]PKK80700.1 hypothetical protein RhiirC2_723791 [Rhizophagus irregularis]PKY14262.1 hypothetical protein RhiirB3_519466 [Rhizophagus irregularis]POG82164.1 hypothetical protein GLOIN_2v1499376 [Rhizophagus irregularis DAOM 181602=DAOM 197198]UZO22977.1 hypothetical protein OCT59_015323 [Rhizophagus irregularis]|eukprot:XP_025189030.1 hypothetical protein GLOIN_2v1499376 [Rhizophagus irregularis DAOM 181602=DAOM 197198]